MDSYEQPSKKRKTLHDFFSAKEIHHRTATQQTVEPTAPISTAVPGVSVLPSFITHIEEVTILSFLARQQWRTDLSRRTIHYGGTYCIMPPRSASPGTKKRIENNIITAPPIPETLTFLTDRMASHGLYSADQKPEYIIVNEYLAGHGISAHIEKFRFDEPVCGLTLGDGDHLRFHELDEPDDGSVRTGKAAKAARTGRKADVWMPSRSLLVMKGEGRWKWQHEIVRGRKKHDGFKRTSLTFRVEKRSTRRGRVGRQDNDRLTK